MGGVDASKEVRAFASLFTQPRCFFSLLMMICLRCYTYPRYNTRSFIFLGVRWLS